MKKIDLTKFKKNHILFAAIYILFAVISIISLIIYRRQAIYSITWNSDTVGLFPDFAETVIESYRRSPYPYGSIYPPLVYLACWILSKLFPVSTYENNITHVAKEMPISMETISANPTFTILFVILIACFVFAICYIIYRSNMDKYKKLLLVFVLVTCNPFWGMVERGNLVFATVLVLLLYCILYDSTNIKIRYVSYVLLGIAVAMKLYPVIFGVLVLQVNRDYKTSIKEALICIVIILLVVFVPFLFLRDSNNVSAMINNIIAQSSKVKSFSFGFQAGYSNTLHILYAFLTSSEMSAGLSKLVSYSSYIVGLVSLICTFVTPSKWKKITLLTIVVIILPGFSMQYNFLYMLIPLLFYFQSDDKSYFYDVMFALMLVPALFGYTDFFPNLCLDASPRVPCDLGTIIPSFTSLVFLAGLIVDSLLHRKSLVVTKG